MKLAFIAVAVGVTIRILWETYRYRTWDTIEDEVERWKESASGRFNAYLDGLGESPN